MARKRGNSNKKSRSKRSSTDNSSSTSPVSTPAPLAVAASDPPSNVVSVEPIEENPDSPEQVAGSAVAEAPAAEIDTAPDQPAEPQGDAAHESEEKPAEVQLATDEAVEQPAPGVVDNVPADTLADDEQLAAPATTADNAAESETADDGKYKIDVLGSVDDIACDTEDQLDDLYMQADDSSGQTTESPNAAEAPVSDSSEASLLDPQEPENASSSVNLEDSEAVLLASNLEDSIYRPETTAKIADEIHAIEQSELAADSSSNGHEDEPELVRSTEGSAYSGHISREYVITPSAFVTEAEPEIVAHIRPESQAAAADDVPKEDSASAAVTDVPKEEISSAVAKEPKEDSTVESAAEISAAVASVLTGEVKAAAEAGDASTRSITDSFIHVSKYLDDGKAKDKMTNREGSEQVERAVSEVMDSTRDAVNKTSDKAEQAANDAASNAKNAANKASDKAHEVGGRTKKAARDAADATSDAAEHASARAKDMIDDASKSVKKAASNANSKAQSAFSKAKESGEKFAKKAIDEANEAERALEREAKATPPATLRTLGVVAAALAVVSGYYFRLPGRDNQRIGFAGGVASAIIGLGTLATAFLKKNS